MQNDNEMPKIFITQRTKFGDTIQDVYDARLLHQQLQSKRQFADWIRTRLKDFKEGEDYISFSRQCEKPLGGRPLEDFLLTIDTVKHICIMEKSPFGSDLRRSFIEAEKKQHNNYLANTQDFRISKLDALKMAVESEEKVLALENKVQKQEVEKQEMAVAVSNANKLCEKLADGVQLVGFRQCASLLGIQEMQLRELLVQNNWSYKNELFPITQARLDGYVTNIHIEIPRWQNDIQRMISKKVIAFRITKKGYEVLLKQVAKLMKGVQEPTAGIINVNAMVYKPEHKETRQIEGKI